MKRFLSFLHILSLGAGLLLTACKDDSKDPMPELENLPVLFPQFTTDLSFYDRVSVRNDVNPAPIVEFTVDPGNQRDVELATIEVYKSFRRINGTTPDLSPRVLVGAYSTFPFTVRISSREAMAGIVRTGNLPLTPPTFGPRGNNPPDAFIFSFEYILKDGRRIVLTPLDAQNRITGPLAAAPFSAVAEVR